MDKYTVTNGANLAYDADTTWQPINIRSAAFQWTASGSGTDEYYLEASGGGNPNAVLSGLAEPTNVQAAGVNLVAGSAGSLANSEWDWADNDTLGFSTVYVRLESGLADPDNQSDGYVTFTAPPVAGDVVYFRGSAAVLGGNFTDIQLGGIIFGPGHTGAIADAANPLALDVADAGTVLVSSSGVIHLSLSDAACSPVVARTASAANGNAGLYLYDCSALNDLFADGGTTLLQNSSVDDVYVASGSTLTADLLSSCTGDIHNNGGTVVWAGSGSDLFNDGGQSTIAGTDAWDTARSLSGTVLYESSGTLTNAEAINTGVINTTGSSIGQTITNVKAEGRGRFIYNNADTTITNPPTGDGVQEIRGGI